MSAEKPQKDLTGVLFPNSEAWKTAKQGRPDFSGECTVNGKRWKLSAWDQRSRKTGKPFLSLALTEFQEPKGGKP